MGWLAPFRLWGLIALCNPFQKEVIHLEDDGRHLYHLTLMSELHGQEVQNGFWFVPGDLNPSVDDALNCFTIVERFNAVIMPYIKNFSSDQLHFLGLICTTIIPHFGAIYERSFETSEGDYPGESLPSYCAGVLSVRTGFGGGSHRGRLYFAGVSEDDSQQSELGASAFARLQAIGDALLAGFGGTASGDDFAYGVYSKKLGLVPNAPPLEGSHYTLAGFTKATQTIARHALGTQKHRQKRVR
jgi:hypothetical protein